MIFNEHMTPLFIEVNYINDDTYLILRINENVTATSKSNEQKQNSKSTVSECSFDHLSRLFEHLIRTSHCDAAARCSFEPLMCSFEHCIFVATDFP